MSAAPFPSPVQASLLALLGVLFSSVLAVGLREVVSPTAAIGIASVVGLGAAGALGAAHVPAPHAERLGLRGLRVQHLLALLLLLPVALLTSEIGRLLALWWPAPDATQVIERTQGLLPVDAGLALLETLVVAVGLAPVIEEWLFRGVIQQGLVATLGPGAGIVTTALLFGLGHGGTGVSAQSWLAIVSQGFALGLAFGYARLFSGSLLAAIGLHAGINLAGVLAIAFADTVPVPGYNQAGAHLPAPLLAIAAGSVGLGAWWLRLVPPLPLRPEPADDAATRGPDD